MISFKETPDIISGIALDEVIEPLLTADLEAKIKSL